MWRSKPVVFRQGRLERVSRDFCKSSPIIRLKTDGEFFFASLLQFQNFEASLETVERLEALNKAEPGLEVYLGAHRLDDGSFWLHWLKCPDRLDLLPLPLEQAVEKAREKLLTWTGLMVVALLFAVVLILGAKTGGAIVVGAFFSVGAVICGIVAFDGLAVLLNKASSEDKAARRGLENLEAALANGHPWQASSLGPASLDPPPEIPQNLPPGLSISRVDQAVVQRRSIRRSTGRGSVTIQFLIYDFWVDGTPVSWPVTDTTYNWAKMPAFRRAHPPFLAPGDEVLILRTGSLGFFKQINLPPLSHQPVLELFNLTDRSAYPSETDSKGALPQLYLVALITSLATMIMAAAVAFFSSISDGLFKAVMKAVEFVGFSLPAIFLTMGVIVLITEAVTGTTDSDPKMVAGRRNWRLLASALKRKTALAKPFDGFWERFFPWRIWATLAATLISLVIIISLLVKEG